MEKVYDFLTKIYSELTEFRNETNNRLGKIEMTIEHDIKPKIQLCLDELVTVKEKLHEHDERFDKHDERFDRIDAKLAIHDAEISIFKGIK